MEPTIPFTENLDLLECCKISISLESDLFDNFEDTASEAEMSDFDLNDLQQIDAIITDTTDSSEHVIESEEILIDVTDCPINASNLKSCLPEVTVTQEQKTISAGVNMLIEKNEKRTNVFLKHLFDKISNIFERNCDSNIGEINSKKWTNFYTELFKLSKSQEYSLMIENCIGKKAESNEFMYFSRVFDYVSHVILERKASQLKGSSEKVNSFT